MYKVLLKGFIILLCLSNLITANTYKIDNAHSDVGFSVDHLGISKVNGEFKNFEGEFTWTGKKNSQNASFTGKIDVASIDTQNSMRDDHLKSPDFFNVAKHSHITFTSKETKKMLGKITVIGDLSMNGITKEVKFPIKVTETVKDLYGNEKIGVTGTLKINRKDFGLIWNKTLEFGGLLVGEEVDIILDIQGSKI